MRRIPVKNQRFLKEAETNSCEITRTSMKNIPCQEKAEQAG